MPVVRSLCINYPFDEMVYDKLYQYQFLCGEAIMVVPVTSSEKMKKFYLPEGQWYDMYTDELYTGKETQIRECPIYEIPLFVKASSVIPMQSVIQSTSQEPDDTLYVHLYNGDQSNSFEYYEDDGLTMDYKKGLFYKRTISFDPGRRKAVFSIPSGSYMSEFSIIKCIFHGFSGEMNEMVINGIPITSKTEYTRLPDGLRFLESIYDPVYYKSLKNAEKRTPQYSIFFPNSNEEISINW
jgi:alpha-glucosidase